MTVLALLIGVAIGLLLGYVFFLDEGPDESGLLREVEDLRAEISAIREEAMREMIAASQRAFVAKPARKRTTRR